MEPVAEKLLASQAEVTEATEVPDTKPTDSSTVHMKRQIGLLGSLSLIVGNIVGSGIFVTPAGLLKRTDSIATSLVVWAACGVISILSALSYIELGVLVPRSGGEHAYFMEAFAPLHPFWGQVPAFLMSWMTVLFIRPTSLAVIALSFGQYTVEPITSAMGVSKAWQESSDFVWATRLLGISIIWFVAFINILSAKFATRLQIVFTMGKIFAMTLIIGIGVYNVSRGQYGSIPTSYDATNATYGQLTLAFYSGLFTYDGWNNLNFLIEEVVDPERTLPLAIIIGMSIVIVFYLLINVAYLTALDKEALMASTAVAADFGDTVLGPAKFIVPLLVVLSTVGSTNGSLFTSGRIGYAASREGHLPSVISYVHTSYLTPTISIICTATITTLWVLGGSTIIQLIDFMSFVAWIFYGLALASVVILRYTQPKAHRTFKIPLVIPILLTILSVFLVIAPIVDQPNLNYLYVLGFALVGFLCYWAFVYRRNAPKFTETLTEKIQCLAQVAPSPYKQD